MGKKGYLSMAIGLVCVLGLSAQIFSPRTLTPIQPIKVLDIQVLTVPSYNLRDMSNDSTFDLSGAPDTTQVTGFSITADKSCDLKLKMVDHTIPLSGGEAAWVYLDDLIPGTQGGDGISLRTFRRFYSKSVTIQGKFEKNGSVLGNLALTIKL
ncbi:hypothetical protein Desor_5154 [Desulfosporosinus orientis DSM 765]|uniref:Uncharacterized protein n=1 Tax=Desulfosporosinus orientis (strain ATCC 19365 / DSM 765 / NCIMB 8382 / VKM B-1628 / Singapore I) TaxID=768706 RepID=G7W735_DESOD|nr:hypothetical protein [Desulfosporosinus orientis]AET70543.1 hypothetical protein Desor_5154 [Desulfosporosinus orientis DSM 765]